jgi:hypothetical protein
LFEHIKIVPAFQYQTVGAIAGDWVSLEGWTGCLILYHETRGAETTATVIRVDKARNVAGLNQSTGVTLNNIWAVESIPLAATATTDVGATAAATVGATDTWVKETAGSTTFTGITTASLNSIVAIDIRADELPDTSYDDFDAIQLQVVSGNATHAVSADYILYGPRYASSGATMPSAIAD